MKRLSNWHGALAAHFLAAESRTFVWGSFDCALFACDCIMAQTGVDPGAAFRGKYATQAQAEAMGSLPELTMQITAQFGLGPISHGHARRGDIVLIDNGTTLFSRALAVVDFTGMYAVCPGTRGLIRVRRHRWLRAWRV